MVNIEVRICTESMSNVFFYTLETVFTAGMRLVKK